MFSQDQREITAEKVAVNMKVAVCCSLKSWVFFMYFLSPAVIHLKLSNEWRLVIGNARRTIQNVKFHRSLRSWNATFSALILRWSQGKGHTYWKRIYNRKMKFPTGKCYIEEVILIVCWCKLIAISKVSSAIWRLDFDLLDASRTQVILQLYIYIYVAGWRPSCARGCKLISMDGSENYDVYAMHHK